MKKKKWKYLLFGVFAVIALSAVAYLVLYNKTYGGTVVDAVDGKPIEGAVVVAVWEGEMRGIAATHSRTNLAKEMVTDKDGNWAIRGPRGINPGGFLAIFSLVTATAITLPPDFIVYKPGYCPWPATKGPRKCYEKNAPDDMDAMRNGAEVRIDRLTKRKDRIAAARVRPETGTTNMHELKIYEFWSLINTEYRKYGFEEIGIKRDKND